MNAASKTNRGATGFTWGSYEHITGTSGQASALTKYNSSDGKTVLDLTDDAAAFNMGGKWRMPTIEEYQALTANTINTWQTNYNGTGVNGRLFISKTDPNVKLFFLLMATATVQLLATLGITVDDGLLVSTTLCLWELLSTLASIVAITYTTPTATSGSVFVLFMTQRRIWVLI